MQDRHSFGNRVICAAMLAMLLTASTAYGGGILFVDDDAPPGGDGTTWETAYRFLQDALTDASGGGGEISEVRVAQGVYKPDRDEANPDGTGDREATFQLINGVALMGGFAGIGAKDPDARDIELFETILSGDLLGDDGPNFEDYDENSYHVVTGHGTDNTATLDGFRVTSGYANGTDEHRFGGGMYNKFGDPTVTTCAFVKNIALRNGGGMSNYNSDPNVSQCTFIGNVAGYGDFGDGGGMNNSEASSPFVTDCTFSSNLAKSDGGGMYNVDFSRPTVIGCVFSDNTAEKRGGGMNSHAASGPKVTACLFIQNIALGDGGGMYIRDSLTTNVTNTSFVSNISQEDGGGLAIQESDASVTNCLFAGNSASSHGGAIYNQWASHIEMVNTTIVGNHADISGGAIYSVVNVSTATVYNSILWGNTPNEIVDVDPAITTVSYSDIHGGWPGTGNIHFDPQFVDPGIGNYHLMAGSPCIDAADTTALDQCLLDLDGMERVVDDPDTPDTGIGGPPVIDMGAYEFLAGPAEDCNGNSLDDSCEIETGLASDCNRNGIPDLCDIADGTSEDSDENGIPDECELTLGDLDGDGSVGVSDLLILLANWGPCGDCDDCPADLNEDCTVGIADLLILLANWG